MALRNAQPTRYVWNARRRDLNKFNVRVRHLKSCDGKISYFGKQHTRPFTGFACQPTLQESLGL
nr:hypothetical protein [Pseudomonas syringae pv. theae]